jgi:tRNA modification GTPase
MLKSLNELRTEIQQHLVDGRKGERLRDGVKMVILGDTNVGKSSLMNLLVQRDVSIVTDIEGTTRDVVESHFDIGGFPVVISDTAGLRKSNDVVESEGISRAKKCAATADLVILVIDGSKLPNCFEDFQSYREKYLKSLGLDQDRLLDRQTLTVVNKVDLLNTQQQKHLEASDILAISCTKSINVDAVLSKITENLATLCGNPRSESPVLSHARHRHFLQECLQNIDNYLENFDSSREYDFAILVEDLRCAVRSIGRITGEVQVDEILDVVFKDFCVGK